MHGLLLACSSSSSPFVVLPFLHKVLATWHHLTVYLCMQASGCKCSLCHGQHLTTWKCLWSLIEYLH
jgi:hypothetical protein